MPDPVSIEDLAEASGNILKFLDDKKVEEMKDFLGLQEGFWTFDNKAIVFESQKAAGSWKRGTLGYISNEKRGPILEITVDPGGYYQFDVRAGAMLQYYKFRKEDSFRNFWQERRIYYAGCLNPIKSIRWDLEDMKNQQAI